MTATIAEQILRIRDVLQDQETETDEEAFSPSIILMQHQDILTSLSRKKLFGEVLWIQAVQGTAQYTLSTTTVGVRMVLYNEGRLDYATEAMLDRWKAGWEYVQGEPQFWTMDKQSPNVIRLVPPPLRSGSSVPLIPPLPMILDPVDNLVVFLYEDRASQANDTSDTLPVPDVWEDPLVYDTVAALLSRETDYQNLPVANACRVIAQLYLQQLGVPR